ncbi:uncharacterized protein L201_003062 [Kwoniella dendrophila CBS 6074]|uniref:Mediator complex subunit 9 n=1 Tax=Kwoniella dendrophila CBS 6074 TaxID=1295534 RepID=A0AAX4JRX5_9TREE
MAQHTPAGSTTQQQQQTIPMQTSSSSSPISNDPLQPGTFQSLLPLLDDIIGILYSQLTDSERLNTVQASEGVAIKAKELASAIESMKLASLNLPGGHLSIDELKNLSDKLDEESEKRLKILSAFEGRQMPLVDQLGKKNDTMNETESVMPSPV